MRGEKTLKELLQELIDELAYIRLADIYSKIESIDNSLKQLWKIEIDNLQKYIELPGETYNEIKRLVWQMLVGERDVADIKLPKINIDERFDVLTDEEKQEIMGNISRNLLARIYQDLIRDFKEFKQKLEEEKKKEKKGCVDAEIEPVKEGEKHET